jgi:hypothetical protein
MSISEEIKQLTNGSLTRRGFAKGIGLASLGIAGATMLGGNLSKLAAQTTASTGTFSDTDILNFALNLEYLEAEFYLKSTWNTTLVGIGVISSSDTTGPTTGGKMIANFGSEPPAFAASGLRTDEVNHVKFLRSALGSAAVKKPAINLDAMGFGFNSWTEFVKLGNMLEDTGMSAYAGAADLISNKTYLEASARILATEGQHVGLLRLFAIWYNVAVPKLDASDVPPSQSLPFLVDASTGLSIARSPQQVLNIVYAGKSGGGGFFPNGLNGNVK